MTERHIIGFTFRVAIYGEDIDVEPLRKSLQAQADAWDDGRRPLLVETALDACERMIRQRMARTADPNELPLVNALDDDTTVNVESFPTLKTGAYRVICESSRSEGARGGYELATRQTFQTFEDAEQYASGISDSRHPLIVAEVERASR